MGKGVRRVRFKFFKQASKSIQGGRVMYVRGPGSLVQVVRPRVHFAELLPGCSTDSWLCEKGNAGSGTLFGLGRDADSGYWRPGNSMSSKRK